MQITQKHPQKITASIFATPLHFKNNFYFCIVDAKAIIHSQN
jgi:hypothetical protein